MTDICGYTLHWHLFMIARHRLFTFSSESNMKYSGGLFKISVFLLLLCLQLFVQPTESFWPPSTTSIMKGPPPSLRSRQEGIRPANMNNPRVNHQRDSDPQHGRYLPSYPRIGRLLMVQEPEESQTAFLSLLKLSNLLKTNQDDVNKAELTTVAESGSDLDIHPSIQLAVGAAKAFGAIDRNLIRAVSELGLWNESLRRMAVEESETLNEFLTSPEASATTKLALMQRSGESVKRLLAMDQRISLAITELYDVGASFKKAESKNNDFIGQLAEHKPNEIPDLQNQAMVMSQTFDAIDARLSKALAEVKSIGDAFKILEADVKLDLKAFHTPPDEMYIPFSPLPEPDMAVASPASSDGRSASSSFGAATETFQSANMKIESALQKSIQVAEAFESASADMARGDDKMLGVLEDLRKSVQRLVEVAAAKKGKRRLAQQQQVQQSFPVPNVESFSSREKPASVPPVVPACKAYEGPLVSFPSAVFDSVAPPARIESAKAVSESKAEKSFHTTQLSQAAAEAWDNVNSNMVANDAKTLAVLEELRASFRALAESGLGSLPSQKVKQAAQQPIQQQAKSDIYEVPTAALVAAPLYSSETSQQPTVTSPQVATENVFGVTFDEGSKEDSFDGGIQLAIEAAKAFDEVNENMSHYQDIVVAVLNDLRASLQAIIDKPKPTIFSSSVAPTTKASTKDSTTTTPIVAIHDSQPPMIQTSAGTTHEREVQLLPHYSLSSEPPLLTLSSEDPDNSGVRTKVDLEQADFTQGIVLGFQDVESNMIAEDNRMHSVLQEISSSLKALAIKRGAAKTERRVIPQAIAPTNPVAVVEKPEPLKSVSNPMKFPQPAKFTPAPAPQHRIGSTPIGSREATQNFSTNLESKVSLPAIPNWMEMDRAQEIGSKSAVAVGRVNDNMVKNDEKAISILREIKASLNQLVASKTMKKKGTITGELHGNIQLQGLSTEASVPPLPAPVTAPFPPPITSTGPPSAGEPPDKQPFKTSSTKATIATSVESITNFLQSDIETVAETARAFEGIDENMVKNDERAISVLNEIRSSLSTIVEAKSRERCAPSKTETAAAESLPERLTAHAPTVTAASLQALPNSIHQPSKPESISYSLPDMEIVSTKVQAYNVPHESAAAFSKVDLDMSTNDKKIIGVLQEISSSLMDLANKKKLKGEAALLHTMNSLEAAPAVPNAPATIEVLLQPIPDKATKSFPVWAPVPQHRIGSTPIGTRESTRNLSAQLESKVSLPAIPDWRDADRAQEIASMSVVAIGAVNDNMVQNDEKAISILQEIKSSLKQLVDSKSTQAKTKVPMVPTSTQVTQDRTPAPVSTIENPAAFNPPPPAAAAAADYPPTATIAMASVPTDIEGELVTSISGDNETDIFIKQADQIMETANAFESMDANMVKNDARSIAVLSEIRSSLSSLVHARKSIRAHASTQGLTSAQMIKQPATSLTAYSTAGLAAPTTQLHSIPATPDEMDRSRDEAALDEFRQMSSVFKELASRPSSRHAYVVPDSSSMAEQQQFLDVRDTAMLAYKEVSESGIPQNVFEEQELHANLQLSIEAAQTLLDAEQRMPSRDCGTIEVLSEIITSLRELAVDGGEKQAPYFQHPPQKVKTASVVPFGLQPLTADQSDSFSGRRPTS